MKIGPHTFEETEKIIRAAFMELYVKRDSQLRPLYEHRHHARDDEQEARYWNRRIDDVLRSYEPAIEQLRNQLVQFANLRPPPPIVLGKEKVTGE